MDYRLRGSDRAIQANLVLVIFFVLEKSLTQQYFKAAMAFILPKDIRSILWFGALHGG